MWFRKKKQQQQGRTPAPSRQGSSQSQTEVLRKLSPATANASTPRPWEEDENSELCKNRKKINKLLKKIGRTAKQDLSLDARGACNIAFKKFLITVEVPEQDAYMCHMNTLVFEVLNARHTRNLQYIEQVQIPNGISVGMNGYEVTLSFSTPISKLNHKQMLNCMETFMQTAMDVNAALEGPR
mmetsp:Transcript_16305/g.45204  ORF Transcript_16305/g.45204 Transcript_16305/m.45204 type:complete len:183 (-) Transcript_16305:530-1078(-)|eukprot:CAMPEP_0198135848 /NCGR_PEP_ID=MMETSP1442-20131203/60803_1 /TAXON_ID= /ORGANISM="Craspedostauros australis, Strain CCMP3328" /LENGTH=182 /DNA_ID=CAMNT_0043797037 /DNA_START=313 /DNA_END=861 /DNA_ORIENTATION=-